MPRDAPSIEEVARRSGVSVTTVSHALSGNRPVNEATAARVREVVAELGYVPATTARNLRTGRTDVIGLIVPDIANTFFSQLARGVEDAANEVGYSLILCDADFDRAHGAGVLVKGIRFASDFDFELQMAHINAVVGAVETVMLPASSVWSTLSSTMVREVASFGGDVSAFVPEVVARQIRHKTEGTEHPNG